MGLIESATVADVAAESLAAVRVLERLGVDYCCDSSRAFADACEEKKLDAAAVLAQIEREHRQASADPNWRTASLAQLAAHIVSTHHEYLKRELPALADRIAKVVQVYGERDRELVAELPPVFRDLVDELSLHMRKEEIVLFPAIEACERAFAAGKPLPPTIFGSVANPIGMMEHEHESALAGVRRFRELTSGYAVPAYACPTYRALIEGLHVLETDLHLHIHLENNILFPRAIALERSVDSRLIANFGV